MTEKKGLSTITIQLMITVALFFDLLQFLFAFIYMDWLVGIFAGLTFWLWFYMKGVKISLKSPKRLAGFSITAILEMIPIPFVASLPTWTAFVVITAIQNRIGKLGE